MKVLFIASGNKKESRVSPIISNQAKSLLKLGLCVDIFAVKGNGAQGYLRNLTSLKKQIKAGSYDIIHAHYKFSGFLAFLANAKPLVVSLMGSEVIEGRNHKLLKFFISKIWSRTIVKTKKMQNTLNSKTSIVIPNGVDTEFFHPQSKLECKKKLGWDINKKHVLFPADPERPEKNFALTQEVFNMLKKENLKLKCLKNVAHEEMPLYYNASDVIMLTSFREGSPNVIKEAMACNRPIICTDVGDVREIIGKTVNCFICGYNPNEIKKHLSYILENDIKETTGRSNIQYLNEKNIANRLLYVYKGML